ncbi:hypothetical protein AMELA_G00272540 [Ameiurus melas]|uniref:Uncharacterized protein n=1 Tax=Ameiurus melas TaxID=219545 RepID=A0A7J5ZNJ6_AMEME|nr:hypothetical protein AMELA_G00272540 [Ameiurus melas]
MTEVQERTSVHTQQDLEQSGAAHLGTGLFLLIRSNLKLCRFLTPCRDSDCERIGRFLTNRNSPKRSNAV